MIEIFWNIKKSLTKLLWIFLCIPLFLVAQVNSSQSILSVSKHLKTHDKHRIHILKDMEKAMGKLPDRQMIKSSDIRIVDSVKETSFIRYNILFTVAKNETIPVYLYIPVQMGTPKKLPAMLVLHETDALGRKAVDGQAGKPNRAHARELAERGYVVIAPDFPSFGDSENYNFETDRYESGTM
ncbi:MAG: hypothetical protein HQ491_01785, partial [Bacteroidetes bacterium]|nr:hypothetical protein [Bacteroidota bacterium]